MHDMRTLQRYDARQVARPPPTGDEALRPPRNQDVLLIGASNSGETVTLRCQALAGGTICPGGRGLGARGRGYGQFSSIPLGGQREVSGQVGRNHCVNPGHPRHQFAHSPLLSNLPPPGHDAEPVQRPPQRGLEHGGSTAQQPGGAVNVAVAQVLQGGLGGGIQAEIGDAHGALAAVRNGLLALWRRAGWMNIADAVMARNEALERGGCWPSSVFR